MEKLDFIQKHPVVTAIGSAVGVLGSIGGLWALWSSEPLLQWIIKNVSWPPLNVQLFGTGLSILVGVIALVMLGSVVWTERYQTRRPEDEPVDHWAQRSRVELHVIANVASNRPPTSSPISGEPENSRLRFLKDEIDEKRLIANLNGGKPNVNTQVGIEDFSNFAKRAGQQLWVRNFADRWERQYQANDNESYLSDTDSELTHCVFMMVLRSGWGRWYTQQPGTKASDVADGGWSTMNIAASIVCDAAMNGKVEIRGRLPGEISYEPIPRESWRLAALSVVRNPATIWEVKVIPRHGVDPERIRRVLSYDSLVVSSRAFEALWPSELRNVVEENTDSKAKPPRSSQEKS